VLETGISLHHTYGVPIIPGSALKGLASHYCHQVWGTKDVNFQEGGKHYCTLFGAKEDAGYIVFHDAWIKPDCLHNKHGLVLDVMTPHHTEYYSGVDKSPTDFDGPIPITFLSVTGYFHLAVSYNARSDVDQEWAKLALELLTRALRDWGIGGKTNVGYGRLSKPEKATNGSATNATEPANDSAADTREPAGTTENPISIKSPRFKSGEEVTVRRVEDPKGKGRFWFEAEDGYGGVIIDSEKPQIEINAVTKLWITAVNQPPGYNFSSKQPKPEKRQQRNPKRVRSF